MKGTRRPAAAAPEDTGYNDEEVLDELEKHFPEETKTWKDLKLDPKEMEPLIAMGFFCGSNLVMNWLKRQNITAEQADKWANATNIVYGRFINKLPIGMVVHGFITLGILAGQPKVSSGLSNRSPRPGDGKVVDAKAA